jgi:hypothetical protein
VNAVGKTHDELTKEFDAALNGKNANCVHPSDRTPELQFEEGLLDLEHMRQWCPTAAYATESALKFAQLLHAGSPENSVSTTAAPVVPSSVSLISDKPK